MLDLVEASRRHEGIAGQQAGFQREHSVERGQDAEHATQVEAAQAKALRPPGKRLARLFALAAAR